MLGVRIISQEIFMLLFNMGCRVKPGNDDLKCSTMNASRTHR